MGQEVGPMREYSMRERDELRARVADLEAVIETKDHVAEKALQSADLELSKRDIRIVSLERQVKRLEAEKSHIVALNEELGPRVVKAEARVTELEASLENLIARGEGCITATHWPDTSSDDCGDCLWCDARAIIRSTAVGKFDQSK